MSQLETKASSDNPSENSVERVKKEFGNMLPKTGVYFLPDPKILDFLK